MRDAASDVLAVPDNFSKETVEAFLHYVYRDALPPQLSAPQTAELAHAAAFFNAQRLAALCEAALADSLLSGGEDEFAADLAPQLLMLADAVSLPHLRSVALHFMVRHFDAVAASPHFEQLSHSQMAQVTRQACDLYARTLSTLKEVAGGDGEADGSIGSC